MPPCATRKSAKLREAEEHEDIQTRAANVKRPRGRPRKNALPDPSLNLIPEVTTRQTEGMTNKRVRRAASADDEAPGDKSIYDVALASGLEVPYEDDTYEYVETPNSPDKTKPPGIGNAKTCQISIEDDGLNISMSFERAKAWGLVTSTPQRETEQDIFNLDVQLSDGFRSCSLEINSGMTLVDLLNAVVDRLGGRSIIEGLSYESTSWSRKIGINKFVPHFLDSQMEVDKLFNRVREYREEQKQLKKKDINPDITLIAKVSGKSTTQKRGDINQVQDALQSAQVEYDNQIEQISRKITMNFKCDKHSRILCGRIRNSNDHIPYTNADLLEHAKMIHKGIPGATVHEVPESLKILDWKKGKQQTSLATPENVATISTVPITQPTTAMEAAEKLPLSTLPSGLCPARNFLLASNWLRSFSKDLERGRDGFDYESLLPLFENNGIVRLDDVGDLKRQGIEDLAREANIKLNVGLVNCIIRYASEDIEQINRTSGW
ncbi:hypothetical protein ACEPAG_7753 [Sanghuangporus baumii]